MIQVFAKDGTIRADFQKYANMADTVFKAENTADLTGYATKYDTAYAKVGSKLKITTTILPEYRGTYFVKAFSINGYSYGIINASQANTETGAYTCEYTIPEDFEGSRIEITPIYYYIDDTDTVTFYVEDFDETVQAMWGNTVAVQAWYANCEKEDDDSNSNFASPTKNALGGYPGQPLVYEGGKYSMQIPKYINGTKANTVSGITLNNYFWDDIHKQSFSDTTNTSVFNCQTYDYDDFYKLSETSDVDNIIFDFRYRTTTDNKPSQAGLSSSTYNKNELENLTDYYGNIVDIFGNILSENWETDYDSQYLTVISDVYKNLIAKSYSKEYNYVSYQNYYIVPVYAGRFAKDEIKESQASIRLLEYTRNQWTDGNGVKGDGTPNEGGSKTDYLYTDFALSFDKNQLLIKENRNIKVGITFEVVAQYNDINDFKSYETDSDTTAIGEKVMAATANGKVGTYTIGDANRSIYRYEIKNSDISVKNRIEYYLQFKNTSNARQNVLKVYSYIYDTVSGEIYLSDPVYMNMYDIGNLTYITSDLANINLGPDATV